MKKILLISDTHGYIDDKMKMYIQQADEVWHAGDIGTIEVVDTIKNLKPLRAVYGNIDDAILRSEFEKDLYFEVEEVTVFMTHIGGYPKKYNPRVKSILQTKKPSLFICGHSHILKVMYDHQLKLLHMNPGAIGKHGFHKVRTMLRFQLQKGEISQLEIIELER